MCGTRHKYPYTPGTHLKNSYVLQCHRNPRILPVPGPPPPAPVRVSIPRRRRLLPPLHPPPRRRTRCSTSGECGGSNYVRRVGFRRVFFPSALVFPRRSIHRSNSKASCSTRTKSRRGANGTTGILFGCGTCQCMTMQTKKNTMHTRQTQLGLKDGFQSFRYTRTTNRVFQQKCPTGHTIDPLICLHTIPTTCTQTLHVDVHHQCHGGGSKTLGKRRGGG